MAVTKEQKKTKRNLLVEKIRACIDKLESETNQPTKQEILEMLAEIMTLAKSQSEVVRLAECVTMYRLNDDNDSYFKGLLRKQLYRLYVS